MVCLMSATLLAQERKPNQAGKIRRFPGEGQGRSDSGAGQVKIML